MATLQHYTSLQQSHLRGQDGHSPGRKRAASGGALPARVEDAAARGADSHARGAAPAPGEVRGGAPPVSRGGGERASLGAPRHAGAPAQAGTGSGAGGAGRLAQLEARVGALERERAALRDALARARARADAHRPASGPAGGGGGRQSEHSAAVRQVCGGSVDGSGRGVPGRRRPFSAPDSALAGAVGNP